MSLLTLFFSGFTSATLLPGSSEALFLLMLAQQTWDKGLLILIAGTGNSLGGMTNWLLGLFIRKGLYNQKQKNSEKKSYENAEKRLKKYGSPVLFFSFLPIIGDPLCVMAGLVKIHWLKALLFISAGKFFRYFILSYFY
ncbi:MAG: DedA family protein [Thiotrichaceae bacterium]|nr:DedA family protein [Thiotrichaceae bacterium]